MPCQDHGSLTEGKQDQIRTQIPKFTLFIFISKTLLKKINILFYFFFILN